MKVVEYYPRLNTIVYYPVWMQYDRLSLSACVWIVPGTIDPKED